MVMATANEVKWQRQRAWLMLRFRNEQSITSPLDLQPQAAAGRRSLQAVALPMVKRGQSAVVRVHQAVERAVAEVAVAAAMSLRVD